MTQINPSAPPPITQHHYLICHSCPLLLASVTESTNLINLKSEDEQPLKLEFE